MSIKNKKRKTRRKLGRKTRSRLKENSLSQMILISIGKFLLESGKNLGQALLPIITLDLDTILKKSGARLIYFNPYDVGKRINDLERRNYIEVIKNKRGVEGGIKLTIKGKMEIIKYKIKLNLEKPKWDGKWRAVCWDIPELKRKDRDYLRRLLKWVGFKEMQKSFWIFPFDVKEEFTELIKLYKVELAGDIRFLIIEDIEDDKDLRIHFGL